MRLFLSRCISLLMLSLLWTPYLWAADGSVITQLHANAPSPCIAKGPDESAGMKTNPAGDKRQQFIGIMGSMAGMFMHQGRERMSPNNIDIVYTAVFYETKPINEIGIYAYLFNYSLKPEMFEARPELTGDFFILDKKLLVLLWREKGDKTKQCYEALAKRLSALK